MKLPEKKKEFNITAKALVPDTSFLRSSLGKNSEQVQVAWTPETSEEKLGNIEKKEKKKSKRDLILKPLKNLLRPNKHIEKYIEERKTKAVERSKTLDLRIMELEKKKELMKIKYNQLLEEERLALRELRDVENEQVLQKTQEELSKPITQPVQPVSEQHIVVNLTVPSLKHIPKSPKTEEVIEKTVSYREYTEPENLVEERTIDKQAIKAEPEDDLDAQIDNRLEQRYEGLIKEKLGIIANSLEENNNIDNNSIEQQQTTSIITERKKDVQKSEKEKDVYKTIDYHKKWLGNMAKELEPLEDIPVNQRGKAEQVPVSQEPKTKYKEPSENISKMTDDETENVQNKHKDRATSLLGMVEDSIKRNNLERATNILNIANHYIDKIDKKNLKRKDYEKKVDELKHKIKEKFSKDYCSY